ncbi:aldehyde dehydrogenase family protein [Rhodococcus pseudokoreensis]|uniref:Aldehyde dehydrogenase family protein n=1 Tax=Rhodococcus pseudokoreensis TaxID=2811421 RepID=A0A974ZWZ2_9NOCA|nr:aldehyde dehydrogenase family protein [Rhodococcus pseudokoreensis]
MGGRRSRPRRARSRGGADQGDGIRAVPLRRSPRHRRHPQHAAAGRRSRGCRGDRRGRSRGHPARRRRSRRHRLPPRLRNLRLVRAGDAIYLRYGGRYGGWFHARRNGAVHHAVGAADRRDATPRHVRELPRHVPGAGREDRRGHPLRRGLPGVVRGRDRLGLRRERRGGPPEGHRPDRRCRRCGDQRRAGRPPRRCRTRRGRRPGRVQTRTRPRTRGHPRVRVARLVEAAGRITVGGPLDEASELGPMIDAGHLEKVLGHIDAARRDGATVLTGGARLCGERWGSGHFVAPTILDGVAEESAAFQEEIFGPVLTVTRFSDVDDAIRLANATEYGLAGSIWTKNIDKALRVAKEMCSGRVWVNTTIDGAPQLPAGGMKQSGFGREMGQAGFDEFTDVKTIQIRTGPRTRVFPNWTGGNR